MSENMIMLSHGNLVSFNTECNEYLDKGYLLAFSGADSGDQDTGQRFYWAVFVKNKDILANR